MDQAAIADSATTSVVDPRERADYWAYLIDAYHCRLGYEFPRGSNFRGHTRVRRTNSYQLVGWESDAVTYLRNPKLIRTDPDEDYRLIVPLAGWMRFGSDAGDGVVYPGTMYLMATDEPYSVSMSDGSRGVIITLPRDELRLRLNHTAPPTAPFDLTTGLGRVTAGMISGMYTECGALTDHQFDTVSEQLANLLCMQILGEPASSSTQLADVEATARRYIHAHACDPDLTGASAAHALGWSLRQLQLAFNTSGTTPSDIIREERLQLARDRLRSPAYQRRSIADIALDLGFGSASSFSKAFRRRFGITPRDLRQGQAGAVLDGRTRHTRTALTAPHR